MQPSIESQVQKALEGSKTALEEVILGIQDRVYNLALRMLWHPADAEDATQEILIKIITSLNSFRHESAFMTWVHRVASNYLLTTRRRRAEREELTFQVFGDQLDEGLSNDSPAMADEVEHDLLLEEVKIGCTRGMLLCLDRNHRITYILGEIVGVSGEEGSFILEITPATFRKRLSRSRKRILDFMQQKCGIFDPENPCRCDRRIDRAIEVGRVDPEHLLFASQPGTATQDYEVLPQVQEIESTRRAAAIFLSSPEYTAPGAFVEGMRQLLESGEFSIFS